eukprot:357233-Chlamydomonas_euryale.AAC.3
MAVAPPAHKYGCNAQGAAAAAAAAAPASALLQIAMDCVDAVVAARRAPPTCTAVSLIPAHGEIFGLPVACC